MQLDTLTIVGVGLIGGSIGLAARRRGMARRVIGVGRSREALEQARKLEIIDDFRTFDDSFPGSDFVVVCTPVDQIVRHVRQAAEQLRADAIITDAGSTKEQIVCELESGLPRGVHFVGSHPLAGSEKKGAEHARDDLFDGRVTVVTPTRATNSAAVERVILFWEGLGSDVRLLDPHVHDRALATTSHLPHLLAAALAGVLPQKWQPFAATGFRDTTRIAAGDAKLWAAIFRQNRAALAEAIRPFSDQLSALLDAIVRDDEPRLIELLNQGKQVRDALGS